MNKLFKILLAATSICAVPQCALALDVISPFPHEGLSVTMPKQGQWHVINKFAKSGMFCVQLAPISEDENNPKTLINMVTYLTMNKRFNALEFAKKEQANVPKLAGGGKMDFKFIDATNPNDVMYELALTGNPRFPDQFEVHHVVLGKDGLHNVIYHVQPANQPESQVKEMISVLKTVKLVPPQPQEKPSKRK